MSLLGDVEPVRPIATNLALQPPEPTEPSRCSGRLNPLTDPGAIHPSLWRASQLARPIGKVVPSGIDVLDGELPGGGWAEGSVAELIVKHSGIGELSMLRGALDAAAQRNRPIWLVGCPFAPNGPELARIGVGKHVRWVKAESPADAQWACETILRSNALGALVAWLPRVRPVGIRRLQGLTAATDALVFAIRSASAANDASASPLRIALEPAPGGFVRAQILKRRGPAASNTLLLPLGSLAHLLGVSGGNRRQVQPSPETSQDKDRDSKKVAGIAEVTGAGT
ncbi:translesion DNA synthesis-associated protein ImuA [Cupriavidus sp. SW-Y-13]|uniref:translesion DNA synthesis-associated protein ImuA n=1 Tax=Cupriavidus sp. SW-Y-13 TaxID=2653854 RepID=UPI00351A710F